MKSLPVPRSRRAVVTATALLGLALAGCAQASPGVVAYVGDDAITQRTVDAAVAGVSSTLQEGQTVSAEAVVNAMIQGKLSEQIAAEQQIAITDADRDAVLRGSNLEPLVAVPDAKEVVYDLADQQIVSQKIGAEAYLREVGRRSVKLNPRYGVLDPAQKTIISGQSGSLSQPVPGPTP
jgi:parvulin-like peptidyl-prolyl isomerase